MTLITATGKKGDATKKDELVGLAIKNFVWCAMTENERLVGGFYELLPQLKENREVQRMISQMISLQPKEGHIPDDSTLEKIIMMRFEINAALVPIFQRLTTKQLSLFKNNGLQVAAGIKLIGEQLSEETDIKLS